MGAQTHEPVSVGYLGHGIPAVERLDPEEGVGSGRTPRDRAWAQRHAMNRHLVGHRKRGNVRYQLPLTVPHLDLVGEAPPCHLMRPGSDQALDEKILAVRRELGRGIGRGRTQDLNLTLRRVDDHQLGGGEVLEESIVVSRLEQIASLVGRAGRGPRCFGDFRSRRNGRHLGSRSTLRDAADEQSLLIRQPTHGRTHQRVERQVLDPGHFSAKRPYPEADVIGASYGEREALAVHRPVHAEDFGVRRQIERCRGSVLDPDQARGGAPVPPVLAVGGGIDAHAGQLVHRRGQLGEGWIKHGIGEKEILARGGRPRPGELRRVEHLQHVFCRRHPRARRLQVDLLCSCARCHRQSQHGESK